MNGAEIMGALFRADAPLTAKVREGAIKGGRLRDDEALPVLLVRSISDVDRQTLALEEKVRVTERVSATLRAASYRERSVIMPLVRSAGRAGIFIPRMGDATNISVLTAGAGPELNGPGDSYERSQDFYVSYDTPA